MSTPSPPTLASAESPPPAASHFHETAPPHQEHARGRAAQGGYDELVARDKASFDIFWLRDDALEDGANLPDPDVIAAEIVEDLRAALEEFELIYADLESVGAAE